MINQLGRAVRYRKMGGGEIVELCQRLLQVVMAGIGIMNQSVKRVDQGLARYLRHAERIDAGGKVEHLPGLDAELSGNGKNIAAMIIGTGHGILSGSRRQPCRRLPSTGLRCTSV